MKAIRAIPALAGERRLFPNVVPGYKYAIRKQHPRSLADFGTLFHTKVVGQSWPSGFNFARTQAQPNVLQPRAFRNRFFEIVSLISPPPRQEMHKGAFVSRRNTILGIPSIPINPRRRQSAIMLHKVSRWEIPFLLAVILEIGGMTISLRFGYPTG